MRIIGGDFRGRKLLPIRGRHIRPTSDRTRESVFNILRHRVRDARVLDLFAGTGALGIEALSRGAASAVFIDLAGKAVAAIQANIDRVGLTEKARIIRWDIRKNLAPLERESPAFDLVFMDPPYADHLAEKSLKHLADSGVLRPGAVVVIEHAGDEPLPETVWGFTRTDRRRYGKSFVTFMNYDMG